MLSFVLTLFLALAPARQENAPVWFPRLESESWEERELAQRRLAAELQTTDAAIVRAALVTGGPETRLRLAHVLSGEDRLFGTAAELAVDANAIVARAGTTALRLAIERFEPYALSEPIPREDLWSALAEHDGAPIDARATVRYELAEIADLLALAQAGSPRIVLDSVGATSTSARRPVEFGAWRELARSAAQRSGGRLVGFGVPREPAPHAVRWLAVLDRATDDADARAGTLVERWCLDFARSGEHAARASAARALCAHGMPPAVAWISRHFRETRDEAALEGLLLAARRGQVNAVLQEPFAREHLWNELERASDLDGARAVHAAIALAGIGLPRGDGASAELRRALANSDPRSPRRAQLALVVLEGWAGARAPDQIGSAIRGLLARADLANGLHFQALRVAARLGIAEPLAGDPGALLLSAHGSGHFDELARLLRGVPNWPPAAWAEDATDPALEIALRTEDVRVALVDAWLARGDVESAARMLARFVTSDPRATERVRDLAATEPRSREAVERAAQVRGLSAQETATWLVACGVATESERRALLLELSTRTPETDVDWLALAELCAGTRGESARARLVAVLREASPEIALAAAQRAVHALRSDLDDPAERAFLQTVRGAIRVERGGPLDRAFRADVWPPPPPRSTRLLRALDRDPARGPR